MVAEVDSKKLCITVNGQRPLPFLLRQSGFECVDGSFIHNLLFTVFGVKPIPPFALRSLWKKHGYRPTYEGRYKGCEEH